MRLLVLSDLHLEFGTGLTLPEGLDFDAVVLAGDIHSPGHLGVTWAQQELTFAGKPVLLVAGNHEFYRCELNAELALMKEHAEGSAVHVLNRDTVVLGGVRFLGCTLWTDFQVPIAQPAGGADTDVSQALEAAGRYVRDFEVIEVAAPASRANRQRQFNRLLRPEDTLAMHWRDRDWLRRELVKPFDGPTVVITHHAPASGSVAAKYAGDMVTPAFVSELPASLFVVPSLWVHGHTHSPADYRVGSCRVLSNPRGYRVRSGGFENAEFNAGRVVEVMQRQGKDSDARVGTEEGGRGR